jgi:hypothetical protein
MLIQSGQPSAAAVPSSTASRQAIIVASTSSNDMASVSNC